MKTVCSFMFWRKLLHVQIENERAYDDIYDEEADTFDVPFQTHIVTEEEMQRIRDDPNMRFISIPLNFDETNEDLETRLNHVLNALQQFMNAS